MNTEVNLSNYEVEEVERQSLNAKEKTLLESWNDPKNRIEKIRGYTGSWSYNAFLRKIGGYRALLCLLEDPEIMAAMRKRSSGLRGVSYEFTEESKYNELLSGIIDFNLEKIKKDASFISFWGYGVHEVRYEFEGNLVIPKELRSVPWYWFKPSSDQKTVYYSAQYLVHQSQIDQPYADYGKYILTSNMGSYDKPEGVSIARELYFVNAYKTQVLGFWASWLQRSGQGFLDATVQGASPEQVKTIRDQLVKAARGSAIVHNDDMELNFKYPEGDGSHFQNFINEILGVYHRSILGEVLTSQDAGSRAAAETHNDVRKEIIEDDLTHLENIFNRLIEYFFTLNDLDKEVMPKVKMTLERGLMKERAERDLMISQVSGKSFSTEYLIKHYGFSEEDFEESIDISDNKSTFSAKSVHMCGHKHMNDEELGREIELASKIEKKKTDTTESLTDFLLEKSGNFLDFAELGSAIKSASNEKELMENLSFVLEKGSEKYDEIFARVALSSVLEGSKSVDEAN